MLLDSYALTKAFEELLTSTSPNTAPPSSYVKRVSFVTSRLFPVLKTLQVRPSPPEALVQAYLIHIADKSDTNFRKILDLKGIPKKDQAQLVELFVAHRASPRNEALPQYSAFLTPLAVSNSTGAGGTGISSLSAAGASLSVATLPGRFDPATLGSALMTAARDGVDRFGSPALGGSSGTGSRTVSPPPSHLQATEGNAGPAANVNQNLRNIGKFFKRDLSGLGGRFGG